MRMVADKGDLRRFEEALEHLIREATSPDRMLEEVAVMSVYPAVADIFDNEGYGAWAGYSPSYAAWKASSQYAGLPILQRTGALRESLTTLGAPGNVHQVDQDGIAIGSDLPYFGVVDEVRPIAQVQEGHFDNMLDVAAEHLRREGEAVGFDVKVS